MEIQFRESGVRRVPTIVSRADHVRLSVPVFGKLEPLPHVLAHYASSVSWSCPMASGAAWPREPSSAACASSPAGSGHTLGCARAQ
jgi:hypothetical protein